MRTTKHWSEPASLQDAVGHGLTDKEFAGIRSLVGRELSVLEIGIFAALYSEHCSYKSSKIHLKTLPTEGPRVLVGPGENAGVVDIGGGRAVVFKIESHNHPSFIEPFQGAATGVGGILRDVFTMGARPVALLNALRFGAADLPKSRHLARRAVAGIGHYGNCVGVPTVGGETFFHEAYDGNCLVNAFALGVIDSDKIFLGSASGVGNGIFYVGSKTGRDGIHGATMASESFGDGSEEKRPTVQVGDPFQEKLLLEACLEAMATGAVVGIQDMGAAGMTSSTFEMADRAGTGVTIDLSLVPQRETGMNPYEIMLSESQERMLLVVQKGREEEVTPVFRRWGLDAVRIGEVTDGDTVELFWEGAPAASVPVDLVTGSVPQYRWPAEPPPDHAANLKYDVTLLAEPPDLGAVWYDLLGSVNLCSRHPIFEQYDSTVRGDTVVGPGGDAAVVRIKRSRREPRSAPERGVSVTLDCNSRYCAMDPRLGTALSVAEAYRNTAAVGAVPIGISNCLNFGSPERPSGMWQLAESVKGLGDAARAFGVPVVSGNVSLYNETKGKSVLPTPQIAMVGLLEDAATAVPHRFRAAGDVVYVVGAASDDGLGGSDYMALYAGVERGSPPRLDYAAERSAADALRSLAGDRLLVSCHDVSGGGLAVALAECAFAGGPSLGVRLTPGSPVRRKDTLLFAEGGPRYVVSVDPADAGSVADRLRGAGLEITLAGRVTAGGYLAVETVAEVEVERAYRTWYGALDDAVFSDVVGA